jgi:peptidoglycan/LPS O-acetylase OafA/YrhL
MVDHNFQFQFSETSSINLYLLRAISAQTVLMVHGIGTFLQSRIGSYIGQIALVFFFFLSGLTVSYSVFRKSKNEKYDFKVFFVNRFSRIFPPLAVILIILIVLDGFCFNNPLSYNISSFIASLFFLNDSCLGIPGFGSARPLWTLPLFWWAYLFFGWAYLGRRTTKKKYLYFIVLALLSFMIFFVYSGFRCNNLSNGIKLYFIWTAGVFILILLNWLDKYRKSYSFRNSNKNSDKNKNLKAEKKFNFPFFLASSSKLSGIMSIMLFSLAIIMSFIFQERYEISLLLLIVSALFFLLQYSQTTQYRYSGKLKKIIKFFASYSFTLFLFHFSLYGFYLDYFAYNEK